MTLANGAAGKLVRVSPDLPPGRTLKVTARGELTIESGADAPAMDIRRPWVIDVLDSPIATIVNVTQGITYEPAADRWNTVMRAARHGDTLEVSPGAVHQTAADLQNYYNGLDSSLLAVWKAVNIRNMPGRGRWWLYPDDTFLRQGHNGITIFAPAEMDEPARGRMTIEGFEYDNWGNRADSNGFKVRQNYVARKAWTDYHESITVRNFKIGKRPFERSASGFAGIAENWAIEDGFVYDTADGVNASPGNDHNFYISGRTLVMRGVRGARTRSAQFPFSQANTADGHICKLTFNSALLEGCVFDCGPQGDNSITVQMKGGGNLVVRSCLLISGFHSQTSTGSIVFEKEQNNFGDWTYGLAGHSVLIERSVFVNHRPYLGGLDRRAMVYFRPDGHSQQVLGVASVVVRDNIGMSPVPDNFWIQNNPVAGPAWSASNGIMPYGVDEPGFADKAILAYTRSSGPLAASTGSLATQRLQWPHGVIARVDAYQGLG